MSEQQFSQEYIDYIRGAKGLQEKWQPRFGDAVLWAYVQYILASVKPCEILRGPRAGFKRVDIGLLTWLPTLHDLLQIIEGADCEWSRHPAKWELYRPGTVGNDGELWISLWLNIDYTEDMLAAAKLAVRALTNRE